MLHGECDREGGVIPGKKVTKTGVEDEHEPPDAVGRWKDIRKAQGK